MKRVLVTGASGNLGKLIREILPCDSIPADLPDIDITRRESILPLVEETCPDLMINAAALTDVDYCELNPERAEAVHCTGVGLLADTGIRLITVSTDHVFFDGRGELLTESSPVDPANMYALSKLHGEELALKRSGNCVVRTSWLNGAMGMVPWMAGKLAGEGTVNAVADQTACITVARHLARFLVDLAFDERSNGVYHCVNPGPVTPFYIAACLRSRLGRGSVRPVEWKDLNLPAPRPRWSALATERKDVLEPFEKAIGICLKQVM